MPYWLTEPPFSPVNVPSPLEFTSENAFSMFVSLLSYPPQPDLSKDFFETFNVGNSVDDTNLDIPINPAIGSSPFATLSDSALQSVLENPSHDEQILVSKPPCLIYQQSIYSRTRELTNQRI